MIRKNLTGQKNPLAGIGGPREPNDKDPMSIAKVVLEHRASSVREDVHSHIAYNNGRIALQDDQEALDKLHRVLINRKVLSTDDVRVALSSPDSHLSMLNKIAKHKDVLLDERVLAYLTPGYSVSYWLMKLYEDLEVQDGTDRIECLVAEIEAMPGELSRQKIVDRRNEIKAQKKTKPVEDAGAKLVAPSLPVADPTTAKENTAQSPTTEPIAAAAPVIDPLADAKPGRIEPDKTLPAPVAIAAALLTPSRSDVTNMIKDYVHGGEPYCMRIGKQMKIDSVVMIVARMNELTLISKQLWYWQATKFDLLILGGRPETPDITRSMAIGVCGNVDDDTIAQLQKWSAETDLTNLGQQILERVPGRRVHLFASGAAAGWETFTDEELWSTEGSNP